MSDISNFQQFGRMGKTVIPKSTNKNVITYTRVSSKDQKEKNCSLETQIVAIEEFALKQGLAIIERFGKTNESAKTNERKEFQLMLEFVKKNKGRVSAILVYNMSRFSRTGGQGIAIADELRQKYGVHVIAVTQPVDTSNANGILFQDMQQIFSRWDNEQRKQNAIAGMKTKFNKGEWVTLTPMGYDIIRSNGVRKIVVNEEGKLLKKAFQWKGTGMKNEQILANLKSLGLNIYKQKLTKILANPFYCGIMCHGLLEGKVIEGNHEKLISHELFLKVNAINIQAPKFGVHHSKENEELPLKKFVTCADCGKPLTGYIVRKKKIYYYKCRTTGCKCNKSAKGLHAIFEDKLSKYKLKEIHLANFQHQLEYEIQEAGKETIDFEKVFQARLKEIITKEAKLEEKFYLNDEMDKSTFDRMKALLNTEKNTLSDQLEGISLFSISNLSETIKTSLEVSSKLSKTWSSTKSNVKESLQKLVYPDGIVYDKQIDGFRTSKVNRIFSAMEDWNGDSDKNKKGQKGNKTNLSLSADRTD